jgi:hypothetical protein
LIAHAEQRKAIKISGSHCEQANFGGQAGKAVAVVIRVLAVMQAKARQMLCLEGPFVVEKL